MSISNSCKFIGNLGKDPEVISYQMDKQMVKLSLAVLKKWKDKEGNWQEEVSWVMLNCFRPGLVDIISKYLFKGDKVIVEAEYSPRKYVNKEGKEVYSNDFTLIEVSKLSKKAEKSGALKVEDENDIPF